VLCVDKSFHPFLEDYQNSGIAPDLFMMEVTMHRYWVSPMVGKFMLFWLITVTTSATAGQAVLIWDPNSETDLAGYKVYIGTASSTYTQVLDVGLTGSPDTPQYIISGLIEGTTYFFAVTAYDASFNESTLSREVTKTIPDLPLACVGTGAAVVWGRITAEMSAAGVPGVTLTLSGPNDCRATKLTKGLGVYWFSNLGDGIYWVVPDRDGCTFEPPEQIVTIADGYMRAGFIGTCP
jgi:hypothetical protein